MKKLILTLSLLGAMYSYNVLAEKKPISDDCDSSDRQECYVIVVTPEGGDVEKEPGINKWEVID